MDEHALNLKWLSLFDQQIFQLLIRNQQDWFIFKDLINANRFGNYVNQPTPEKLNNVARQFWNDIKATEYKSLLLFKVCEFVKKADPQLTNFIAHRGISKTCLSDFLFALDKLNPHISLTEVFKYFCAYSSKAKSTLYPIWTQWSVRKLLGDETVRRILFYNLPFLSSSVTYHLIHIVWKNGDAESRHIIINNWPRFEQIYDYILNNESKAKRLVITSGISVDDALNSLDIHKHDPFESFELPKVYKSFVPKEVPILLREYQKELAAQALKGQNVLITAPTNSGKTVVAAKIIHDHYRKSASLKSKFKVAFLVPRRVLVKQQADLFQRYFGHCLRILQLAGMSYNLKSLSAVYDADIVVMTPQILLNNLNEPFCESNQIDIDLFSLIIFDECHDAKDYSPYNKILQIYHDTKTVLDVKMPQIIGLTASVGIGSAIDVESVVDHAVKICANLDAHYISCVRQNLDELFEFVPAVAESIITCDSNFSAFLKILEKLKSTFEKDLLMLVSGREHAEFYAEIQRELRTTNLDDFRSALSQILIWVVEKPDIDLPVRQQATHLLSHLIALNDSIQRTRLFNKTSSIRRFQAYLASVSHHEGSSSVAKLKEALTLLEAQSDFEAPILTNLTEILRNTYAEDPEMRCMIFIKTRELCVELAQLIKEYTELEADYLTGCAQSEKHGLNDNQQQQVLEAFREGRIKVLCATSVAEEGLDIVRCNLVINFDYSTSFVARVQRKGRGRVRDSRSILLAESSSTKEREERHIAKESLMKRALDYIGQNSFEFQRQVDLQILENKKERDQLRLIQMKRELRRDGLVYSMCCRKCDGHIAHSKDIYKFQGTLHVVADFSIWSRVKTTIYDELDTRGNPYAPGIGKISCKNIVETLDGSNGECKAEIGTIVWCLKGNFHFPVFKCENVVFIDDSQMQRRRFTHKQWKTVTEKLFDITPITYHNMLKMIPLQQALKFNTDVNSQTD